MYFGKPFDINTCLDGTSFLFYFSGLMGIVLSALVERRYQQQKEALDLLDAGELNKEAATHQQNT